MPYFVFDHFNIGSIRVYTWGLFVGLGFCAGYFWLLWQAGKKNIDSIKIIWLSLLVFVGALLGSRLLFLLQTPQRLISDISLLWDFNGGSMFFGGLLGAIFFGWFYVKKAKLDFKLIADLAVPAAALGVGIGRIGCFLINDHLGAVTNLPWGILWPDGLMRHPVALYESLAGFLIFAALWYLKDKIKKSSGLFLLFLASYSVIRFLLDFLRESQGYLADPRWLSLTSSQWVSIFIILYVTFCVKKSNQKSPRKGSDLIKSDSPS